MTTTRRDVFLSYSHGDVDQAREIDRLLRSEGIHSWFAEAELIPGSRWDVQINGAVDNAEVGIVLIGPSSVSSFEQSRELGRLLGRGTPVIPVLLPGAHNEDVPVELRDLAYLDLRQEPDPRSNLVRIVSELSGHSQAPARSIEDLADSFRMKGNLRSAADSYRKALEAKGPHAGADPSDAELGGIASVRRKLSSVYGDLGQYDDALREIVAARNIDETVFGPGSPIVGTDEGNLGVLLRELGRISEAQQHFERALSIKEAAFGPEHPEVGATLNNLGAVRRDLGDLVGARQLFERALRNAQAAYGSEHPEVGVRLNNLATILWEQGELVEAKQFQEHALAIQQDAYGPNHPEVGAALSNLAALSWELGDADRARELYERALGIAESAFGPDHPDVGLRLNNLAVVCRALGDYPKAKDLLERALAIESAAYGPEYPGISGTLVNLANVFTDMGDDVKAQDALERARVIQQAASVAPFLDP